MPDSWFLDGRVAVPRGEAAQQVRLQRASVVGQAKRGTGAAEGLEALRRSGSAMIEGSAERLKFGWWIMGEERNVSGGSWGPDGSWDGEGRD
ncbi:hypothetical protein IMZ48_37440 [Candidatus Bathyarchaeota archaeon]|nr:hypothetical protein [Candidatus Bathyarchaeota archaeon]